MEKKQAFILFGASGSGKGTQAELIQKRLEEIDDREVMYIQTGQRFRDLSKLDNYVARRSAEVTEAGGLQPVFLSVWNWTEGFMEDLKENQHLIIDGSPRRRREPPILESAFDFFEYDDVHIIFLNVPDDVVRERMMGRGRADDDEEKITRRLEWFNKYVIPMLDFYRNSDRYHFHEIDGTKTISEIHEEIKQVAGLN